jgi:transposase
LPNDEAALAQVFTTLTEHGPVLVIVDQPASIGALPIAVARSLGIEVAYLPGLAMRRIADLRPGEGKTDARDAYVIADAARTMPHALRRVGTDDETLAELSVLAGYDDDLAAQATRLTNRLRDALLHVHPALDACSDPVWTEAASSTSSPQPQPRKRCASSGTTASPPSCALVPHAWPSLCPRRSSPHSMPRPSSFPAPQ